MGKEYGGYDINTKMSRILMEFAVEGAASSRCNKAKVAGEVGSTGLLAGGSCDNLPDTDYSTFELFSEGDSMASDMSIKWGHSFSMASWMLT